MSKAAVFSPYWDTLGGGEKYIASAVSVLTKLGYQVELFWHDPNIINDIEKRYDYDLSDVSVNQIGFDTFSSASFWQRMKLTSKYDAFLYVSDGSFPFLFSKKNILHFQVPFTNPQRNRIFDPFKQKLISSVICNSNYTKQYIDEEFNFNSLVVYPPATMIKKQNKKNQILSVGRFDNLMHSKRQDVLIDAFTRLRAKNWKLILAGGVLHGKGHLKKLKQSAKGNNIDIIDNPKWSDLSTLFSEASIYWHAAGYGADLNKHPQRAEHFGISTVEAMSAGAVPVVFDGGGLPEIIKNEQNGYLWKDIKTLISLTNTLITDNKLRDRIAHQAQKRSHDFSLEVFEHEFEKAIS